MDSSTATSSRSSSTGAFRKNRNANSAPLLVSKGDEGLYAGRSPRGNVAREEGDRAQKNGDEGEGRWVGGVHAEQEASENGARDQGGDETDREPGERQAHALAHYHPDDVSRAGPEGHADSDLARPLGHGRREHTVDTEGGEREGRGSEEAEDDGVEARLRESFREEPLHGGDVGEGDVGIALPDFLAQTPREGCGVAVHSNRDHHFLDGELRRREVERRLGGGRRAKESNVLDHPDDLEDVRQGLAPESPRCRGNEPLAERIGASQVGLNEGLVHDDGAGMLGIVEIRERPAPKDSGAHRPEVIRAHDPERGAERGPPKSYNDGDGFFLDVSSVSPAGGP